MSQAEKLIIPFHSHGLHFAIPTIQECFYYDRLPIIKLYLHALSQSCMNFSYFEKLHKYKTCSHVFNAVGILTSAFLLGSSIFLNKNAILIFGLCLLFIFCSLFLFSLVIFRHLFYKKLKEYCLNMIKVTAGFNANEFHRCKLSASLHQDVINEFVSNNIRQNNPRPIDIIMSDNRQANQRRTNFFERKHKQQKKGFFRTYIDIWVEIEKRAPIEYRLNYSVDYDLESKSESGLNQTITFVDDTLQNSRDNISMNTLGVNNSYRSKKSRHQGQGDISTSKHNLSQEDTNRNGKRRRSSRRPSFNHSRNHYDRDKHHHNHVNLSRDEGTK